jgi:hypothetical protein
VLFDVGRRDREKMGRSKEESKRIMTLDMMERRQRNLDQDFMDEVVSSRVSQIEIQEELIRCRAMNEEFKNIFGFDCFVEI